MENPDLKRLSLDGLISFLEQRSDSWNRKEEKNYTLRVPKRKNGFKRRVSWREYSVQVSGYCFFLRREIELVKQEDVKTGSLYVDIPCAYSLRILENAKIVRSFEGKITDWTPKTYRQIESLFQQIDLDYT
jgi:hypothetical protein